jgi:hypothetical protein
MTIARSKVLIASSSVTSTNLCAAVTTARLQHGLLFYVFSRSFDFPLHRTRTRRSDGGELVGPKRNAKTNMSPEENTTLATSG